MKYLFVLSEKFYSLIEWEWNFLKQLRRKRRKNIFLRCSFALMSLLSILIILMKYFFLLSEKFYRFIEWEWNTIKNQRRTKRKNFFLRVSFALFILFSILFLIFSPPIVFGMLFGEGLKFSIFFIWLWILNLKFF